MATMTDNRYVPTWERNYDRWETEPDTTLAFDLDDEELENDSDEISIDDVDENDLAIEFDDEDLI
jgi:hypothetical protein